MCFRSFLPPATSLITLDAASAGLHNRQEEKTQRQKRETDGDGLVERRAGQTGWSESVWAGRAKCRGRGWKREGVEGGEEGEAGGRTEASRVSRVCWILTQPCRTC